MAALKSQRRLKKEGADLEPKTCPTGMMRKLPKTYVNAIAKSG
jgi:hypothetical protein